MISGWEAVITRTISFRTQRIHSSGPRYVPRVADMGEMGKKRKTIDVAHKDSGLGKHPVGNLNRGFLRKGTNAPGPPVSP